MSAPLYSRFCRYADREAKRFPRNTPLYNMVPTWKRPSTTVYALSDKAAYEAGWWSTESPGELLRGISLQYLPTERIWIEWNWRDMIAGSQRQEGWDGSQTLLSTTGHGETLNPRTMGTNIVGDDAPLRVGALIRQTADTDAQRKKDGWFDLSCPPGSFMAMLCYLYPNGTFFLGPTFSFWHGSQTMGHLSRTVVPDDPDKAANLHLAALGTHYVERWDKKHPRLMDKLVQQMAMILIGQGIHQAAYGEVQGTTRLIQAALMAAISAKPTQYDADPNLPPRERKGRERGKERRVVEVDLFMRERRKPGASIKASAGHMEAVKKGLHTVGAHYAYRSRDDGKDPTRCTVEPSGIHDFEEIHGTASEVCILCSQKRWFKKAHERGDEAYGIVPRRVRNVRVGDP